jgi:DNA-binding GntR family transcriptional regulator
VYRSIRITEDRVAEFFDVSRTVARDALARLHSSGVVDKDRQGRWTAERITPQRIRSLYELRWLIEPEALIQSARATPVDVVGHARDKVREALRDLPTLGSQTHIDLENDLHVRLLAACPNTELLRVLERTHLLLVSNPHRLQSYIDEAETQLHDSLRQHIDVLDLILRNKHQAAARALRNHLEESCAFWVERWDRVEAHLAQPLPPYLVEADTALGNG